MILVTRPRVQGELFMQELTDRGYASYSEPVFVIRPLAFQGPDLASYQGLIFTSANALSLYARQTTERDIPLYVVGKQTQEAAYDFGFQAVFCAHGNAAKLAKYIDERRLDKAVPLLHVRAVHVAYPLQEALQQKGYAVEPLMVYDTDQLKVLSKECQAALREGPFEAVTFFSRRTAETFLKLIQDAGLEDVLGGIKALCLSKSMLQCVRPELWQGVYVAAQPDRTGMLNLIARHCTKVPRHRASK